MNIALFIDCFTPMKNGVITSLLQLKEGLESKNHHVVIISIKSSGYENKDPNVLLFPQFSFDYKTKQAYGLGMVKKKKLLDYLKNHKIELIHTHTEYTIGLAGKYAARSLNLPRVATSHTMWEQYTNYSPVFKSKLIVRRYLKSYYDGVSVIVAPSIKSKAYNDLVVPNIPKAIIPNGINMNRFKAAEIKPDELNELRAHYGIKADDKILIFVGRIGEEKRVTELLDSLGSLLKRQPKIKMLFVGDGPDLHKLKNMAKLKDLGNSVIFTGFVNWEQVYKLYSLSNIFLSASLSEVHPMTLIEAAMSNLPIITRRDDSYLDLVYNNQNGFLVDSDAEIALKAEELLFDEGKIKQFAQNSFQISQKFTMENHVDLMEALYKSILNNYKSYREA